MVPTMGCIISCEETIDLTEFKVNISDNFDTRVPM